MGISHSFPAQVGHAPGPRRARRVAPGPEARGRRVAGQVLAGGHVPRGAPEGAPRPPRGRRAPPRVPHQGLVDEEARAVRGARALGRRLLPPLPRIDGKRRRVPAAAARRRRRDEAPFFVSLRAIANIRPTRPFVAGASPRATSVRCSRTTTTRGAGTRARATAGTRSRRTSGSSHRATSRASSRRTSGARPSTPPASTSFWSRTSTRRSPSRGDGSAGRSSTRSR